MTIPSGSTAAAPASSAPAQARASAPARPKPDKTSGYRPGRQLGIAAARATGDVGDLPDYVRLGEVRRAIHAAAPDVGALIGFLWSTGARISEALAVTPADLDTVAGTVTLPSLKRRRQTRRVIPVPGPYLAAVLAVAVRRARAPHDRIWTWTRKHAWERIRAAMIAGSIERRRAHPHALRHGHAVHAVLAGVPLNIIQRQLGHASITTTAIYLRVTAQDVREAYAGMEW